MKKHVEVSVILPTYNRVSYIGETLESVLKQNFKDWECIVVDDGSTDHTEELLAFYSLDPRIRYFKRPEYLPKGANSCRNYGFSLSRGKYINWFDSDDIMLPGFLEKKIKHFGDNIDMVICKGYYTNDSLKVQSESRLENTVNLFKSFVLWESHLLTPCILFRRSFLDTIKKFDPDIHKGQEAEFFSRILYDATKMNYRILEEPLFYYRLHGNSSTIRNKEYIKDYKRSEAIIGLKNLERGISMGDHELVNHLYLKLLFLYFSAIDNKDWKNSWLILKKLIVKLKNMDLKLSLLLTQLIVFPGITGKRSYNLERKLRLYKID